MIRPATLADVEIIGQLWHKLASYHHELDNNLPKPAENGHEIYARQLAGRLADSHTRILVAEDEKTGQVIGFVLGVVVDLVPDMFEQKTGGFLADIYVDTDYRKQGIGKQLVNALIEWFKEQNITYMQWNVSAMNTNARQFWQRLGGHDSMIRMRINLD